jgi:hypothetical protein
MGPIVEVVHGMIRIGKVVLKADLGVLIRRQRVCENGAWTIGVFQLSNSAWRRIR